MLTARGLHRQIERVVWTRLAQAISATGQARINLFSQAPRARAFAAHTASADLLCLDMHG
ncbi:hypothetical protein EIQ04_07760 [Xanthomonas campestris pv. raphani]